MTDFAVYPRDMDFGSLPAGAQSRIQWVHLTNYKNSTLDCEDWGINGHFISQRPTRQWLNQATLANLNSNAPASGSTRWILEHNGYTFEGNTTSGIGVFKVDAAGVATEMSRYTSIIPAATGGGFYHDGRFLYVRNANGLHILKLDKYDNLILLDIIDPNSLGIESVHGWGGYVYTVDSAGITVLEVSRLGIATVIQSLIFPNAIRVWARRGWVFAFSANSLFSYEMGLDGRLTQGGFRFSGGGVSYENLTGDDKFIYITDDSGSNDLISLTTNDKGDFFAAGSATLPVSTHYGLYFDGGYLVALDGTRLDLYSVDRDTGALNFVKYWPGGNAFRDAWFDGTNLIVARSTFGIVVFGFDDSRIRLPVYYTPLGYEQHEGLMQLQNAVLTLVGKSPAADNPYVRMKADSIKLESDVRWDKITYEFFGSFDRVEDVKDANPHIPTEIKARAYVPRGSIVHKPVTVVEEDSTISAVEWRQ